MTAHLTRELRIPLEPSDLAEAFCEMDDDDQARFFVWVASLLGKWRAHARLLQIGAIGEHLADCECSTQEARELVHDLAEAVHDAEKRFKNDPTKTKTPLSAQQWLWQQSPSYLLELAIKLQTAAAFGGPMIDRAERCCEDAWTQGYDVNAEELEPLLRNLLENSTR